MVPGAGIEPARPEGRQILSLLRLPISPPGRGATHTLEERMEARAGVEPAYVDLQSSA